MGARYSRNSGYTISKRTSSRSVMRTTKKRISVGPNTAKYIGLAVLAILALVMLSNSSKSATDPYNQSKIRKDISQVDQDIDRLQLEAKRAQSLQEIEKSPVKDQMQQMGTDTGRVEEGTVAGVSTSQP